MSSGPAKTREQLDKASAKRRMLVEQYAELHNSVLMAIASEDHLRRRLERELEGEAS